jgi:hypothetical protein
MLSREPRFPYPKGARLLIGGLYLLLAVALAVFVVRFLGMMKSMDVSVWKIVYVPLGAGAMAAYVAYRGVTWLRRHDL